MKEGREVQWRRGEIRSKTTKDIEEEEERGEKRGNIQGNMGLMEEMRKEETPHYPSSPFKSSRHDLVPAHPITRPILLLTGLLTILSLKVLSPPWLVPFH